MSYFLHVDCFSLAVGWSFPDFNEMSGLAGGRVSDDPCERFWNEDAVADCEDDSESLIL